MLWRNDSVTWDLDVAIINHDESIEAPAQNINQVILYYES